VRRRERSETKRNEAKRGRARIGNKPKTEPRGRAVAVQMATPRPRNKMQRTRRNPCVSCFYHQSHAGSSDRCATVQKHGVLAMGLLQECIVFVSERRVMRLLNRDKNTIAASCYPSVQFVASGRRFRVASTHADAARRSLRCGFQNQQPNSLQQHGDHETNRTFSVTRDKTSSDHEVTRIVLSTESRNARLVRLRVTVISFRH